MYEKTALLAGAARVPIEIPPSFFPYEGFAGLHDLLYVRALVLADGVNQFLWVVADLTSLPNGFVLDLKKQLSLQYGLDELAIWIGISHTFQSPHIKYGSEDEKDKLFCDAVKYAIFSATDDAMQSQEQVRLGMGVGTCDVNCNRDVLTSRGWWKGSNPEGPSDKHVRIIRIENLDGNVVALWINYAVQSSVLQNSVSLVSGDLAGLVTRTVECQFHDDVVAIWGVGAAGDQDPLFKANWKSADGVNHTLDEKGAFGLLEMLADRLSTAILHTTKAIITKESYGELKVLAQKIRIPGQEIFPDIHTMKPTKKYVFIPSEDREVTIHILVVDSIAFVGLAPELVCVTAKEISDNSPYRNLMLMTMVNGGMKYLPDAASYEKITYAAMNSYGAKGAAELVRDAIIAALYKTMGM